METNRQTTLVNNKYMRYNHKFLTTDTEEKYEEIQIGASDSDHPLISDGTILTFPIIAITIIVLVL